MKQKFMRLLLLLSLCAPMLKATTDVLLNGLDADIHELDAKFNHSLVYISNSARKSIVELHNLLSDYQWSKLYKDMCNDLQDECNVALYDQVDQVVNEGLAASTKLAHNQSHSLQTNLQQYKEALHAGKAQLNVCENYLDTEEQAAEPATRGWKKKKKICRLTVGCLFVKGSGTIDGNLSVGGTLLVDGVNFNSLTGVAGAVGAAGAAGPQGIPGIPGVGGILGYGYIYNLTAQTVAVEASVPFDSNGPLSGITHTASSPSIGIVSAGTYAIVFSVSGTEPNQFAIFVNGVAQTSTVYGSGAGTQQNTGVAILVLGAGDVVTLVNHSSAAAVGLASVVGGTQANVNASVMLLRLT